MKTKHEIREDIIAKIENCLDVFCNAHYERSYEIIDLIDRYAAEIADYLAADDADTPIPYSVNEVAK